MEIIGESDIGEHDIEIRAMVWADDISLAFLRFFLVSDFINDACSENDPMRPYFL
jgi:hypothetical protein